LIRLVEKKGYQLEKKLQSIWRINQALIGKPHSFINDDSSNVIGQKEIIQKKFGNEIKSANRIKSGNPEMFFFSI